MSIQFSIGMEKLQAMLQCDAQNKLHITKVKEIIDRVAKEAYEQGKSDAFNDAIDRVNKRMIGSI